MRKEAPRGDARTLTGSFADKMPHLGKNDEKSRAEFANKANDPR
jgi:hypothetical protein